jgi:hypothetical protein
MMGSKGDPPLMFWRMNFSGNRESVNRGQSPVTGQWQGKSSPPANVH